VSNTTITPAAGAVALAGVAPALSIVGVPVITMLEAGGIWLAQYFGLTTGVAGAPIAKRRYTVASMQAEGVFGSGGSVQLEGTDDLLNFHKLSPSALTAAGLVAPLAADGAPLGLRPNVTAGDSTTALNVTIVLRG